MTMTRIMERNERHHGLPEIAEEHGNEIQLPLADDEYGVDLHKLERMITNVRNVIESSNSSAVSSSIFRLMTVKSGYPATCVTSPSYTPGCWRIMCSAIIRIKFRMSVGSVDSHSSVKTFSRVISVSPRPIRRRNEKSGVTGVDSVARDSANWLTLHSISALMRKTR